MKFVTTHTKQRGAINLQAAKRLFQIATFEGNARENRRVKYLVNKVALAHFLDQGFGLVVSAQIDKEVEGFLRGHGEVRLLHVHLLPDFIRLCVVAAEICFHREHDLVAEETLEGLALLSLDRVHFA